MSESFVYNGNTVEIRTVADQNELYINGEKIEIRPSGDLPNAFCSNYSYLPSGDLSDLARNVIDGQLALKEPKLMSLRQST